MDRTEFIANVRHIGWVYYQIAAGQTYNEIMNEDQYNSLLDGIKYADANPDMSPEENHNNWMKQKAACGWVYGPTKDFDLKTHPDMVPFEELPVIEQRKDVADHIGHRMASRLYDEMIESE